MATTNRTPTWTEKQGRKNVWVDGFTVAAGDAVIFPVPYGSTLTVNGKPSAGATWALLISTNQGVIGDLVDADFIDSGYGSISTLFPLMTEPKALITFIKLTATTGAVAFEIGCRQ